MIKCTISNRSKRYLRDAPWALCVCESHDVKIFLILALFDCRNSLERPTSKQHHWIEPSLETFSCQSNRLRYSVAGATKDAAERLKYIHLRRCSELRGWRLSLFGKKSSDWEKRVFDIGTTMEQTRQ